MQNLINFLGPDYMNENNNHQYNLILLSSANPNIKLCLPITSLKFHMKLQLTACDHINGGCFSVVLILNAEIIQV